MASLDAMWRLCGLCKVEVEVSRQLFRAPQTSNASKEADERPG
jgi:hypothetical protein